MDKGRCCYCLSLKTGGTIIGLLVSAIFLQNLVCSIMLNDLLLYFGVNTTLYGAVTISFIRHITAKDKKYYLYSKLYFFSYLWFVYVLGNVWNFVFWYGMPDYLTMVCKEDLKCIDRYQIYGFYMWVGCTIVSSYCSFVLREYKNRMFVTNDEKEAELIETKLKEIRSERKRLTEKLLSNK